MPILPLLATLAVQTLATMALYSMPTLAPAVARDLHVNGALVGGFVATAYGVGIVSALLSPGLIRRYGGVRTTQAVLLAAAGMLAIAASSLGIAGLACAAIVLGSGYGAAAPASTHLLVPHTPRSIFNLVMSLRQIGVPLGGVFAALILPPLVPILGWRGSLLVELVPVFLLMPVWSCRAGNGMRIVTLGCAPGAGRCCSRSCCCGTGVSFACPCPASFFPVCNLVSSHS